MLALLLRSRGRLHKLENPETAGRLAKYGVMERFFPSPSPSPLSLFILYCTVTCTRTRTVLVVVLVPLPPIQVPKRAGKTPKAGPQNRLPAPILAM